MIVRWVVETSIENNFDELFGPTIDIQIFVKSLSV